jgi:thiamine-phosphate pyrophosphorylase
VSVGVPDGYALAHTHTHTEPSVLIYSGCMSFSFPKIYPILDSAVIPLVGRAEFLYRVGSELVEAGVTLLEYRNKTSSEAEVLADAAILRATLPAGTIKLILDDRADLVERVGFDGVHVDAGDAAPAEARRIVGSGRIVGTFGGSEALLPGILQEPVDYLSIGPVFATTTKQTTKTPIGVEGVCKLRAEAGPHAVLVAVGGVSLESAPAVLAAGATVIAVAAAIFRSADPAAEFRRWKTALS